MDIPLRHSITLSGAWKILFPSSSSMRETGVHQKEDVEAGSETGVEDYGANVSLQADEPEDVDGLNGSDSDDTSNISDTAASLDYSQVLRLDSLLDQHRGPEILQDFASNNVAHTERLLRTILIQHADAEWKEVWIELRGSVAAKVIDTVERARKAMAEFEESTDSWEAKEERLRRALRIQVDTVQERKEVSRGIVIQNLGFARKEEVVEEGEGKLYDGQDTMRSFVRSQDALLRTVREKDIEIVEAGGSIEAKSAELHDMSLEYRGQENVLPQKPSIPREDFPIEGGSTSVQQMLIETQENRPSESTKANLFKEARSEMEVEFSHAQIYEMDAGELSGEAKNHDGSLQALPDAVTETAGQEVPAGKVEGPTAELQESGLSKQQQRERLNAMWRVSSAYVKPIAGITNDPHAQTHDPDCSRQEMPGDISISDDAARRHEGTPIGTALQEKKSTQAIPMEDSTSLDDRTDSNPHPINSSTAEAPPEAATEVATAAVLEQLNTEQDDQEDSNVGACVDIAKFDKGLSRFTLKTHMIFSIIYAIWIAVLYRFIATALC